MSEILDDEDGSEVKWYAVWSTAAMMLQRMCHNQMATATVLERQPRWVWNTGDALRSRPYGLPKSAPGTLLTRAAWVTAPILMAMGLDATVVAVGAAITDDIFDRALGGFYAASELKEDAYRQMVEAWLYRQNVPDEVVFETVSNGGIGALNLLGVKTLAVWTRDHAPSHHDRTLATIHRSLEARRQRNG